MVGYDVIRCREKSNGGGGRGEMRNWRDLEEERGLQKAPCKIFAMARRSL